MRSTDTRRRGALTGMRYGMLVVIAPAGRNRVRAAIWRCRCDCGAERTATTAELKRGRAASCGCTKSARCSAAAATHGLSRTPEHIAWGNMIQRCTNPGHPSWPRYGGRGIQVCERWRSFDAFLADVGPRPGEGYSIDRSDNNRGYEPGNCSWATASEQNLNKRVNRRVTINGTTMHVSEWAARLGIPTGTLGGRASRWERAALAVGCQETGASASTAAP